MEARPPTEFSRRCELPHPKAEGLEQTRVGA